MQVLNFSIFHIYIHAIYFIGSAEETVLTEVAEANRETVVMGQVQDKSVKVEGTEFGKLYMFRDFGEPLVAYSGAMTAEGITEFLNAERFPLIDEIGPENYKDYVDRGLPLVRISLNDDDADEMKSVIDSLTPYAEANKGKLSFTYVDAVKYAQHVQNLGMCSADLDRIYAIMRDVHQKVLLRLLAY